jgi:5'-phosphate synthase pdxT subunit
LVKLPAQLDAIDALIIPGGESTTMNYLIDRFGLREPLLAFGAHHSIWGTCAGMIMVSSEIEDNQALIRPLALMDISVVRNGYGRQVHSFEATVAADLGEQPENLTATFIRAPRATRLGAGISVLARHESVPVLLRSSRHLVSSFHSELGDDTRLLEFFLTHFAFDRCSDTS